MDALVAIDEFGNIGMPRHTDEHVCVVTTHVLLSSQEIDHFANGLVGRDAQIVIEAHADVVGGCFCPWIGDFQIFTHDELEFADEGGFNRSVWAKSLMS